METHQLQAIDMLSVNNFQAISVQMSGRGRNVKGKLVC